MSLCQVTITGADTNTDIPKFLQVAQKYPYVEWGMLIARGETGDPKYPSLEWFDELVKQRDALEKANNIKLQFSVHMCNDLVLELADSGSTEAFQHNSFGRVLDRFDRVQLNFTRSIMGGTLNKEKLFAALANRPHTFVFQLPDFSEQSLMLVYEARARGIKALPFFDLSSGRGILPESWPAPAMPVEPHITAPPQPHTEEKKEEKEEGVGEEVCSGAGLPRLVFGYSGGLGPQNVVENVTKIQEQAEKHNYTYWVDMETRVRTDNQFDLSKCVNVLELTAPFLEKS
mmetsp:Transcript_8327/g.15870  ORF Transcript_8327/g.15870 Transcript_8327/m.15870 type:complete len:287 (-) Transcript_8327:160-1020(-)